MVSNHLARSLFGRRSVTILAATLALAGLASLATAGTYYVDTQNPAANDGNAGTAAAPYKTISRAVSQHPGAGNTVIVLPGVYPERVNVPVAGASGSPFVLQANGPGVILEGTEDFSSTASWASAGGDVYLASSVNWVVAQVFVDGQRLSASTVSPATSIPANSFEYVAGSGLYVNVGGGNPGTHDVRVGHRLYGFYLDGSSWITIRGFDIRRSDSRGIYLVNGANHVEIRDNNISLARFHGINVVGGSDVLIDNNIVSNGADHGILLATGVTHSVLSNNESFGNARRTSRAANGIQLFSSSGNQIVNNRLHDNEDTGLQMSSNANDNVSLQNRSWNNGDHGFDHLNSSGAIHIGDVSFHNFNDGFSFEGAVGSPNGRVYDCIGADNGLTTNNTDLFADSVSAIGMVTDHNVWWNSTAQRIIQIDGHFYTTIAAYTTATGNDAHGVQANPRFVNGLGGDFHLLAGSPAIDHATSAPANWPATDAEGHARFDDPATTNAGAGPVAFADIGALEFTSGGGGGTGQGPVASLVATPASGPAPLTVELDASGSHDDGQIVAYAFDFGDGSTLGNQDQAKATHIYAAGTWTARVTVRDNDGNTASATAKVTVTGTAGQNPVASLVANPSSGTAPLRVELDASGSHDDGQIVAYAFDFGDGGTLAFQDQAKVTHTYASGTWTARVTVRDNDGNTASATAKVTAGAATGDQAPVVTSPSRLNVRPGQLVTFTVRASDPDGDPIQSLKMSGRHVPERALFTVNDSHTQGTFRWRVPYSRDVTFDDHDGGRRREYTIVFTATNALTGSHATEIHVRTGSDDDDDDVAQPPLSDAEIDPTLDAAALPHTLALSNGYPNPARAEVTLALDLPRAAPVEWTVFDLQGRAVSAHREDLPAGTNLLQWDGTGTRGERVGAGLYLVRVRTAGQEFQRRIVRY